MCRVAFDEVKRRSPDCGKWLTAENIEIIEASNQILREALRIKQSVGIIGDNFNLPAQSVVNRFGFPIHIERIVADIFRGANSLPKGIVFIQGDDTRWGCNGFDLI